MISSFIEYAFFVLVHATWITAALGLVGMTVSQIVASQKAAIRYRIGLASILFACISVPILLCTAVLSPPEVDDNHSKQDAPSTIGNLRSFDLTNALSSPTNNAQESHFNDRVSRFTTRADRRSIDFKVLKSTIVSIYLVGLVLYLARLTLDLLRIHRLRARSWAAPEEVRKVFNDLDRAVYCEPALRCSSEATTPMLVGFFKPAIILPSDLANGGTRDQIEAVLLHEIAHCQSWDHFWLPIQKLALSIMYFHPSLWVLDRLVDCERELAADQSACLHERGSQASYALALVEVAENLQRHSKHLSIAFVGRQSFLTQRVRFILNPNCSRPSAWLLTLFVTLVACFSAGLAVASPSQISSEYRWNLFLQKPAAFQPKGTLSRQDKEFQLIGFKTLSVELDTILRVRGRYTTFEFCESPTDKLVVAAYQPHTTGHSKETWSFGDTVSISQQEAKVSIKDLRGYETEHEGHMLLRILMPHSMSVDLRSFKGNLTITRSLSNLDANLWGGHTRIGPVNLEHTQIKTGIGTISAETRTLANSKLSSGSGTITTSLQTVEGEVILHCGSGDLFTHIAHVSEPKLLKMTSQSGDIIAEVPQKNIEQIKVFSKTGNVFVNQRILETANDQ